MENEGDRGDPYPAQQQPEQPPHHQPAPGPGAQGPPPTQGPPPGWSPPPGPQGHHYGPQPTYIAGRPLLIQPRSILSGVMGGLGITILLQQYGQITASTTSMIFGGILGAVVGVLLPSIGFQAGSRRAQAHGVGPGPAPYPPQGQAHAHGPPPQQGYQGHPPPHQGQAPQQGPPAQQANPQHPPNQPPHEPHQPPHQPGPSGSEQTDAPPATESTDTDGEAADSENSDEDPDEPREEGS